jgi:hypothetical protein
VVHLPSKRDAGAIGGSSKGKRKKCCAKTLGTKTHSAFSRGPEQPSKLATRAQDFIPSPCHLSRANVGSHFGGLYLLPPYAKIVGALKPLFLTILERLCTKAVDNNLIAGFEVHYHGIFNFSLCFL